MVEHADTDAPGHLDLIRQAHGALAELWDSRGSPPGLAARHRRALEALQARLTAAGVDPYPPGWRGHEPQPNDGGSTAEDLQNNEWPLSGGTCGEGRNPHAAVVPSAGPYH